MNKLTERISSAVAVGMDPDWMSQGSGVLDTLVGEIIPAKHPSIALTAISQRTPELTLVSAELSPGAITSFIEEAQSVAPEMPVVVVSEVPSVDDAVRYVRAGAADYIGGPLNEETLLRLLEGLELTKASRSQRHRRLFSDKCPPGVEIVGQSPGMVECLEKIRLVAESRCNPVLILGETGTGKELAARAVHWWRYGGFERLIAVNCAALTANLLESELFGHVKGAFTGADREKTGLFQQAVDGAILLDEISEMPLELQAKLLRVVQEGAFRKVGGTDDIQCNATVIATSNRNLLADVESGKFRKDLYYRLAVFPIFVPPLACETRRSDIALLAEYFLEQSAACGPSGTARISPKAIYRLGQHDWPGNARELRNVIERAAILEKSEEITVESLLFDANIGQSKRAGGNGGNGGNGGQAKRDFSLEAAEKEFIVRALEETGWQRTRAAGLLGITRATLHAKLKRYDIKPPATGKSKGKSQPIS